MGGHLQSVSNWFLSKAVYDRKSGYNCLNGISVNYGMHMLRIVTHCL